MCRRIQAGNGLLSQKLLKAPLHGWRSEVAIVPLVLLKMDCGGGKAKLSGRTALLTAWSQGQQRPGSGPSALPLMLGRSGPNGGPPRFRQKAWPSLCLGLTVPCRMDSLLGRSLRSHSSRLASRRPVSEFLERPQGIRRHHVIGGLRRQQPLSRRSLARQRKQGRSDTDAYPSHRAHSNAPRVISRIHERYNSRIGASGLRAQDNNSVCHGRKYPITFDRSKKERPCF